MTNFKPEALFEALADGHTVVTGNSRLARVLGGRYGQWQTGRGQRQWASPQLLSWNAWLSRLWDGAALDGLGGAVPGSLQLLSLWETVLREDSHATLLLRPESLASQLADTRRLLADWQVDMAHPAWFADGEANENHAAFRRWNRAFEALCENQGWTPPEDCLPLLTGAARDGSLAVTGPLLLLGFDEINPAQRALLDALAAGGTRVHEVALPAAGDRARLWKSSDPRAELERMARWVRRRHEENPQARIGVVVPELAARRQEVERVLRTILVPGLDDGQPVPWNVSLGTPLAGVPLIDTALCLLRLPAGLVDIRDAGLLLRAPWLQGGSSERGSRALLEKRLRDEYPRRFSLGELRFRAGEMKRKDRHGKPLPEAEQGPQPWNSPLMEAIARKLLDFQHDRAPRTPSAWAVSFDGLLKSCGWPRGDGAESAGEHDLNWQAYRSWQNALRALSSLDATCKTIGLGEALSRLQRICRETVFQARNAPAVIQVLGLYEVIGLRFDHLWVLGLHGGNWPPPARPNPFIPAVLQARHGLPHSSPQRELSVAQTITQRLLDAAPDCVFSYPGQVDGEETLASPLLLGDRTEPVEEITAWEGEDWSETMFNPAGLSVDRLEGPGPHSGHTARGGTAILRNQAACPFRAFAVNRLGAEGLSAPVDGIPPSLHGSLLHAVMEAFWRETLDQQSLLALDDEALAARLQRHIEAVLDERRDMRSRPAFREAEAARLLRLALAHLELEKTRAPFTVTGFEQAVDYTIDGETIHLVIDRIDRLPGGEEAIIDYKTGRVKPDRWFGDRPEEPQLPLYAVSAGETPAAVVYAVMRDDGCAYLGVVREAELFPGLPASGKANERLAAAGRDLPETTTQWKQVLHALMAEFQGGKADVQPTHGRKSCDNVYCELQALCRIGELEQLQVAGQEEVT